jgi:predicted naringenin-chalcone synthase
MDVIRAVHDAVVALADDDHPRIRQYALIALGTLDDVASLARLQAALDTGTADEATSAVWGLALRADGLAIVLADAADRRDDIVLELLQALAEVSAPMTDAQLTILALTVRDPRVTHIIERHLARTRPPRR